MAELNIIDKILKPFSEKLKNLEEIYKENNKITSSKIDIQDQLNKLLFKEIKVNPSTYTKKFDFEQLPIPKKTEILDILETKISDYAFSKKMIEYRLLEIKKQLLIFEELVIQYMHVNLIIIKMEFVAKETNEISENPDLLLLIQMKQSIKEHLEYIVNDENIEIFKKIYCKNILMNKFLNKINDQK
jgi:hypothetical protein